MVHIGICTGSFMVFRAFSPRVPPAGENREVRKPLVLLGLQPFFRRRNSPRFPHACTRFVPLLPQFFGIFCCILSFFDKKENPRNPCNCWGFGDFLMAGAEGLEPSARGFGAAVGKRKITRTFAVLRRLPLAKIVFDAVLMLFIFYFEKGQNLHRSKQRMRQEDSKITNSLLG